ncbi:MAG TPA: 30S ribosomal protein S20 [Gemmatimonadales bacterium]|nr:30S ribosomal protein S20 [Gemmatimonadales bacterium]
MPRIKSAEKRMRQARARTAQNKQQRSRLRTAVKKVRQAASSAEAQAAFRLAEQLLDRAGRKNLIHRNAAARLKSRLSKLVAAKSAA